MYVSLLNPYSIGTIYHNFKSTTLDQTVYQCQHIKLKMLSRYILFYSRNQEFECKYQKQEFKKTYT